MECKQSLTLALGEYKGVSNPPKMECKPVDEARDGQLQLRF